MEYYKWDHEKNERLKSERGVSFEEAILCIERGDVLDVLVHPKQSKYPNQQILVVRIRDYAYLIPFVEVEKGKVLKTIIPSRKATREYLGGKSGRKKTR
jgi:uncharacterized DUF497 family protein